MRVIHKVSEIQKLASSWRMSGLSIGFVPTMGSFHEGHLSLIKRARKENERLVVSIFVNPLQFGPGEDYDRYPKNFPRDSKLCRMAGTDAIFNPSPRDLYPLGFGTVVEVQGLSDVLCGQFRPGHFKGVSTVVLKLLEVVGPARAYFGEKDYQQLAIIRKMASDLNVPVEVVPCPTVRENNGLAMSSRNSYLSRTEREQARKLYRALLAGKRLASRRGASSSDVANHIRDELLKIPKVRIDYVKIVNARTLGETALPRKGNRILAAVRIGKARLIDNIPL